MLFNSMQLWYDDRHSTSDRPDSKQTTEQDSARLFSPATTWYGDRRPSPPKPPVKSSGASVWQAIWSALTSNSNEPRVRQIRDRSGHLIWQAYDPITNQTHSFDSENGVRVWIEHRYHQTADTL